MLSSAVLMRTTRIHIRVDGDGLITQNVKGANIDESLKVICHRITNSTGVTFSGRVEGNVDDEYGQLKVLFSGEISEEKGDEIDSLLSEINASDLTFLKIEDPIEVAQAARDVYLTFDTFIRASDIPEEAMPYWNLLRDTLGLTK